MQLPPEVLVLEFCRLYVLSLARVAATCSGLYRDQPRPMIPVEEALRERAATRGHVSPGRLPEGVTSWVAHLAWLERRRDEAWDFFVVMATGGGFWVLVVGSFHTSPWGETSLDLPRP